MGEGVRLKNEKFISKLNSPTIQSSATSSTNNSHWKNYLKKQNIL